MAEVFNEEALRAEIIRTWGPAGAHVEVFDALVREGERMRERQRKVGEMLLNSLDGMLALIRGAGWSVAVHNDYVLDGKRMTFWGFSKGDRWMRGEGPTDEDALKSVLAQIGSRR